MGIATSCLGPLCMSQQPERRPGKICLQSIYQTLVVSVGLKCRKQKGV